MHVVAYRPPLQTGQKVWSHAEVLYIKCTVPLSTVSKRQDSIRWNTGYSAIGYTDKPVKQVEKVVSSGSSSLGKAQHTCDLPSSVSGLLCIRSTLAKEIKTFSLELTQVVFVNTFSTAAGGHKKLEKPKSIKPQSTYYLL